MEITLIAVTMLSLFLAISMGVVAWRLVQEERRRSDARLAALAAELQRDDGPSARRGPDPFVPALPADSGDAGDPASAGGGLFSPPVESASIGWTRLAAIGGTAAVAITVAAALFLLSGSGDGDAAATAESVRPPLDLIALRHVEEGPFLDISGSVRNPAAGAAVERLSVVAIAFDSSGTLVATRRIPVETSALSPGADSAFLIRLLAAGIARYRISFLLDDTTVPHMDLRPDMQPTTPAGDSS